MTYMIGVRHRRDTTDSAVNYEIISDCATVETARERYFESPLHPDDVLVIWQLVEGGPLK